MNGRIFMVVALIATLAVGCKKSEHEGEQREEAGHAAAAQTSKPANVLEIEETMLRDLRVRTAQVELRPGGEGVSVVGEVRADQTRYAEVGAPTSARVIRLAASAGQRVRAGQLLAVAQSVELGRVRAEYERAQSRVTLATSTLERKRGLADRIVPRREVQEAEADLAAARSELRAASAALQALGASARSGGDASRLALVSPIAGTVLERNLSIGQMIDPEHVAFRIGDLGTVWLVAHAFERDAVRVAVGTPARVTLAAFPGQLFAGRVAYIGAEVDPASRTIPIRIELANPQQILRPGMSATAWLSVSDSGKDVVAVPASALQRLRDQWVVFIPKSDRTFEIRPVGRGRDLQGEVEILSGLKPGETVVLDGSFLLKAEAEKAEGGGEEHEH
jgi:cobalt-zinc-cadmium efflux system membrane fusion protein